jgi:hypothetical protein
MAETAPFAPGELETLVDMLNLVCARLSRQRLGLNRATQQDLARAQLLVENAGAILEALLDNEDGEEAEG